MQYFRQLYWAIFKVTIKINLEKIVKIKFNLVYKYKES